MNARPTPKQIVEDARKMGIIGNSHYQHDKETGIVTKNGLPIGQFVKLPEEAGIARFRPTPPPAPCKLLKRAKREAGNRKYIITKKDRPELFKCAS